MPLPFPIGATFAAPVFSQKADSVLLQELVAEAWGFQVRDLPLSVSGSEYDQLVREWIARKHGILLCPLFTNQYLHFKKISCTGFRPFLFA